jgi:hypothetical protein
LFGEPGVDLFSGPINFIFYVLLIVGIAFIVAKLSPVFDKIKPYFGWFYDLPYSLRKFLSVFSFVVYCAACFALIVYISS